MAIYSFNGHRPILHDEDETWLAPSAEIIGKIELEERVSIWFGAVLRGDNENILVGSGSNIQDLCVIHTDLGVPATIGKNCSIGHKALIHGATIGDNTLVGMGAIVMNHSSIGNDSIIGAGSVVTQGKVFEPRSLIIGNPARFVRYLTDEEIYKNIDTAMRYQAKAMLFKKELLPS